MHKRIALLLALVLLLVFLTACYDSREIDDFAYVVMMGIEHGVSDRIRLTLQIPEFTNTNMSDSGGGGGGNGGDDEERAKKENITVEAPSIFAAVAEADTFIPKTINFMHLNAVVVSEDFASSGEMKEFVVNLLRYHEIRRNTSIIVCKGSARDFVMAARPYLGSLVTETMEELISKADITGYFPKLTISDFAIKVKSTYTQALTIYAALNKGDNFIEKGQYYTGGFKAPSDFYAGDMPRTGGQEIELLGTAVFELGNMVGKLTGFETQMVELTLGNLKRTSLTIPDPLEPELYIPIEIKELEPPRTHVDIKGEKPMIHTTLSLEGEIVTIPSGINYESPDMKGIVEEAVAQHIADGIKRTFAKCQTLKTDVFEYGTEAVRHFWTIQEWENYNWRQKFSEASLMLHVDFTLRRTGRFIETAPVQEEKK